MEVEVKVKDRQTKGANKPEKKSGIIFEYF